MKLHGLQSFVKAPLNEARLNRQWGSIAERLDRPRSAVRWPVAAAMVLVACVVAGGGFLLGRSAQTANAWDGAVLESRGAPVTVAMRDGSEVVLEPNTKLVLRNGGERSTLLTVEHGGAAFDVAHVPGRSFEVALGDVTVRVVGTRFTVREVAQPSGAAVEVAVSRGAVEARAGDTSRVRLSAGQKWSVAHVAGRRTAQTALVSERAPSASGTALPTAVPTADAPAPEPKDEAKPSTPVFDPHERANAADSDREPARLTAKQLFEAANRARAAGDVAAAARGYRALVERFPRDPRASLASFELGRLQMDQLGQPSESIDSLKRSMASSKGSFREDAMARLVAAHAESGDRAACREARRAYLKQYPKGVHRATVQAQCGEGSR